MTQTQIQERRADTRLTLLLPVQIIAEGGEEFLSCRTADVSPGGLLIESEELLEVGTEVDTLIQMEGLDTTVQAHGTVVRWQSGDDAKGKRPAMAIEFSEKGKLGWSLLRQLLEAQQRESAE